MSAHESAHVTAIVLAAGAGTRMRSERPKVLHEIGGLPLVGHALAAVAGLGAHRTVAVIGHGREQVAEVVAGLAPDVLQVVQEQQRGTGHAVKVALDALAEAPTGTVVVTYGDVPLLTTETLVGLIAEHEGDARAVTILSSISADPGGYGRIVRDAAGRVLAIREHRDATDVERLIPEINSGVLAVDADFLLRAVAALRDDNDQGELYLTDIVAHAVGEGLPVGAHVLEDVWQTEGVNDRVQLAQLGRKLNERLVEHWMRQGVTVVDPVTTWIDSAVELAPDVTLLPGTQLLGATVVATGATIGPDTTLRNVEVGERATVVRTHGSDAVVGPDATVGPFAYLRPGTLLDAGGKIGTFVETKNAHIGPGAKVPHLSYVGDAEIGEGSNIGAGTITANYDGQHKHRTTVGKHARTGSDNVFVAPVTIGDGAYTAAGTTVRDDVPSGALAIGEGRQRMIDGWVEAKRPGTSSAEAARRARENHA
ncbi:bifunctional UDP-N-acetylglucosamine diphosphorylase/glucosamine-1-phosphate N-acetyltransferase GlmU [Aeromicrobium alkaliterrae]|uniref:bifunctional UDP-N-acetylglucosamine diphosphorylase/glucosamine-1-phosphate N-acetyltransferase GlmU n=1 Tax=Aeromicrobium alkaliterrae TaxID=302168 RepID=UPI0031DEA664